LSGARHREYLLRLLLLLLLLLMLLLLLLLLLVLLLLKPEHALGVCWMGWGGAGVATATATLLPKLRCWLWGVRLLASDCLTMSPDAGSTDSADGFKNLSGG
jgi:hypothetical protein